MIAPEAQGFRADSVYELRPPASFFYVGLKALGTADGAWVGHALEAAVAVSSDSLGDADRVGD